MRVGEGVGCGCRVRGDGLRSDVRESEGARIGMRGEERGEG